MTRLLLALTLILLCTSQLVLAQSLAFADLPQRTQTLLTLQFDVENVLIDHDDDPRTPEVASFADVGTWFVQRSREFWAGQADYQRTLRRRAWCADPTTQARRDAIEATDGVDPCAG